MSIWPNLEEPDPYSRPRSVPESKGLLGRLLQEVLVVPFNHKDVTERVISDHEKEVGCIIVEPIFGAVGVDPSGRWLP